jgi:cytochrome c oxidase subunit IV
MFKTLRESGYKTYWATWFVLLLLTLGMVLLNAAPLPRAVLLGLLVCVMLAKASLIGANFMHLRFEKVGLALIVVVGILGTAGVLFLLLAVDGVRVLEHSTP